MIDCVKVGNDAERMDFIINDRGNLLGEPINVPSFYLLLKEYGYIFMDDQRFIGSFVLVPYSKYYFPKPMLPEGYRPKSNFAHIGFITSSKNNNIFDIIKSFSETLENRSDLIFPLTITAKASTNHGLLFQYICGFKRAFGDEDITNAAYGAITINKPLDGLTWARKNFKRAMLEYRRDIDKYQHAIHP